MSPTAKGTPAPPPPKPSDAGTSSKDPASQVKLKTIAIDGIEVQVNANANFDKAIKTPTHSIVARTKMTTDEIESLRKGVTRGAKTKFSLIHPNEKAEKALEQTASLMNLVADMQAHLFKFDVNGVFKVKTHDAATCWECTDGGDLHKDFASIKVEAVAASNLWCTVAPLDPLKTEFARNLEWSYDHLCNSMTDELKQECLTVHRKCDEGQQGGPLLFKTMMDMLLVNTRVESSPKWDESTVCRRCAHTKRG